MKFKGSLLATIIGGVIVLLIAVFVIYPIRDIIFNEKTIANNQPGDVQIKFPVDSLNKLPELNTTKNQDIYFLHSFEPREFLNDQLIITLNNIIQYSNQKINLKITDKNSGKITKFDNKELGDVIHYEDYIISLLSLDKNISTYTLKIKFEHKLEYKAAQINGTVD